MLLKPTKHNAMKCWSTIKQFTRFYYFTKEREYNVAKKSNPGKPGILQFKLKLPLKSLNLRKMNKTLNFKQYSLKYLEI